MHSMTPNDTDGEDHDDTGSTPAGSDLYAQANDARDDMGR